MADAWDEKAKQLEYDTDPLKKNAREKISAALRAAYEHGRADERDRVIAWIDSHQSSADDVADMLRDRK